MRRLVMTMAAAVGVAVGGAIAAGGPAVAQTTTPPARTAVSVAAAAGSARADDNATVCAAAKRAVEDGAKQIMPKLREAAEQLRQGDKSAADATVKAVGPRFGDIGTSLTEVANTASDPRLKSALTGLSAEFTKAGKSVTDVDSMRKLDQSGIQSKGREVSQICGFDSSSGPSSSPSTTS